MHTQGACTGSNVYTCVREGPCSERLVGPRAHTVPTTARSPFSVLMAAHKPSGVRGVRGPCRAHSTQGSDGGSGRRAAHRWARCVHGSRAPRSACTRAALSTQPMRSAGAGRQATWGSPARSAAHRGAHQLLSCDGLSGVNGSVASRGVSAAYTIHVRVYIFATARAAAANIAEREASQQPTPDAPELADARVSSKRSYSATDPGPPRHCIPSRPISLLLAVLHHVGLRIRLSGGCSRRGRLTCGACPARGPAGDAR